MDPITAAIVAAISAGAVGGITDVGKQGIVDAYDALKSLLKKKFGSRSELIQAIDKLEVNPSSRASRGNLEDEIEKVKAVRDPDLLRVAQHLQYLIQAQSQSSNVQSRQHIEGDHNVQQQSGRDNITVGERGKVHTGSVIHRHPWAALAVILLILLVVLGIIITSVIGIMSFAGIFNSLGFGKLPSGSFGSTSSPEAALQNFCSNLGAGNVQGAYDTFSNSYHRRVSPAQFADFWQPHKGAAWNCLYQVTTQADPTAQATLTFHQTFGNGSDTYTVSLINENGDWKIDDVHS